MIELALNHKSYGGRRLFGPLSLKLAAGELVCLLGPSGCGKTTLLNLLAGLDTDYCGVVRSSHHRISYMFQEPRLLPWRTVRQNLALVAEGERGERIDRLLALMDLSEQADHYPRSLSLGMARRVALARTLLNDPDLILMDEPFVSLDPPTAAELGEMLGRLRRERPEVAILMVTHDVREALALSDRILVLGGRPTRVLHQWQPGQGGDESCLAQEKRLQGLYDRGRAPATTEPVAPWRPATQIP